MAVLLIDLLRKARAHTVLEAHRTSCAAAELEASRFYLSGAPVGKLPTPTP